VGQFADALHGVLRHVEVPSAAAERLASLVDEWREAVRQEKHHASIAEAKKIHQHEDEKNRLVAQLNDARERLRQTQDRNDEWKRAKEEERRHRLMAEAALPDLRQSVFEHRQDAARLRQQLSQAQAATRRALAAANREPTREELVEHFAKLECEPLWDCSDEARAVLKKKLLLKWHPDKQPTSQHVALATQVMQELQNRSEWSW